MPSTKLLTLSLMGSPRFRACIIAYNRCMEIPVVRQEYKFDYDGHTREHVLFRLASMMLDDLTSEVALRVIGDLRGKIWKSTLAGFSWRWGEYEVRGGLYSMTVRSYYRKWALPRDPSRDALDAIHELQEAVNEYC